jgi:hypothetical protein
VVARRWRGGGAARQQIDYDVVNDGSPDGAATFAFD